MNVLKVKDDCFIESIILSESETEVDRDGNERIISKDLIIRFSKKPKMFAVDNETVNELLGEFGIKCMWEDVSV